MSIFQRPGSPFYYAEARRGRRRICRSTGTTSRREARAFEQRLKRELANTPEAQHAADSLDAAFGRYWLDHASHLRSAVTTQYYIAAILKHMDPALTLSAMSNADVAAFVALRRRMVSNATVNREMACLRAMHRMAGEEWEYRTRAISWRRHRLTEPRERVRWISQAKARQLLAALPDHIADAAEWSMLTGCRKMETYGLDWQNIDMQQRTARIWAKGGRWDEIDLPDPAWLLLANLRGGRTGPVFSARNLRKYWAAACKQCELEDFRWHDMRHTYATWLRQQGTPVEIVQKLLRHRDISTTMRYAHIDRRELREAVRVLPTLRANKTI